MYEVIAQAGILILCGVLWRYFAPQGVNGETLRHSLTSLVYVLLLPAMVLLVLWQATLSLDALLIAALAAFGILVSLAMVWLWFRGRAPVNAAMGAILLAAAFPNVTYLGLPVLEATLGSWARTVAIQYDLFASTPLLLSLGVFLAQRYGGVSVPVNPLKNLLRVPALWAALLGVSLNLFEVPLPSLLAGSLEMLATGVIPLMLFSLGLALSWGDGWRGKWQLLIPVVLIQLLLTPLLVWGVAGATALDQQVLIAVVLEAAMPTMVLGIVLCDRYRLDSGLYAMAVSLTTILSMLSLPLWFAVLG